MVMRFFAMSLSCFFMIILPPMAVGSSVQVDHVRTLKESMDRTFAVLNDPSLSKPGKKQQRREIAHRIMSREFDYSGMARRSVGKQWQAFSREQKQRFMALFKPFFTYSYLRVIEHFKKGNIRFTQASEIAGGKVQLDSLIGTENRPFRISYNLVRRNGGWKVVDVIVAGISVTGNYYAQFTEILRRPASVEGLLAQLAAKVGPTKAKGG